MKNCLSRPEQACTPVGTLSGGERARLILARTRARSANLLVLVTAVCGRSVRCQPPLAGDRATRGAASDTGGGASSSDEIQRQRPLETACVVSLQAQAEALNAELADPRRSVLDQKRFVAKTASFAAAHEELTAAEHQWLTLALRREEIKAV